jgi:hypothetical protein
VIEVIERDESWRSWSKTTQHEACRITLKIELADVHRAAFKVSGYHFAGTAVCEERFYVHCPDCNGYIFIPGHELDELAKREIRRERDDDR